jgi:hypothetical protein
MLAPASTTTLQKQACGALLLISCSDQTPKKYFQESRNFANGPVTANISRIGCYWGTWWRRFMIPIYKAQKMEANGFTKITGISEFPRH